MGWQMTLPGDRFNDYLRNALFALEEIPFRKLKNASTLSPVASLLPKSSTSLISNLNKDLLLIDDPRLAIITVHLYYDHILHLACGQAGVSPADTLLSASDSAG